MWVERVRKRGYGGLEPELRNSRGSYAKEGLGSTEKTP